MSILGLHGATRILATLGGRAKWTPLSKQHPALRVEAVRAEFELTGVHRTSPENFIRKIAGFPKDCWPLGQYPAHSDRAPTPRAPGSGPPPSSTRTTTHRLRTGLCGRRYAKIAADSPHALHMPCVRDIHSDTHGPAANQRFSDDSNTRSGAAENLLADSLDQLY
jgi:hypothetical protein